MITIIFGAPGAGKSSLNTYFLKKAYFENGRELLNSTRRRVQAINEQFGRKLTLPDAPPIYADYDVKIHTGYKKWYEPYFINGYYFGLPNDKFETQFVYPNSRIHFSEAQRYYNSRKSTTLPDWVSRAFEMHRHYGLEIYLDVQRPALIDLNIRELCKRFIEVLGMTHYRNDLGEIYKTVFRCREFTSWAEVDKYIKTGEGEFIETSYVDEGNIFECFNSTSFFEDFLPPAGKDFTALPSKRRAKEERTANNKFYAGEEPKEFRGTK